MNKKSANPTAGIRSDISLSKLSTYIASYLKPYLGRFWLGTLLAALSSMVWLAIPWAFGEIISLSAGFEPGDTALPIWQLIGAIATASLLYYSMQEVARYFIYLIGNQASVDLQKDTLKHLVRLNLSWHETENSGNKLKKISRGGNAIREMLALYVNMGIDTVVSLVGISIIFFALDWQLSVILVVFLAIQYNLGVYLTGRAKQQAKKVNKTEEEFAGIKFELVNNIQTVKSLGADTHVMDLVDHKTHSLIHEIQKRIILFRTRLAVLGVNQQLFRLLIIGFAAWKVIQGDFEVGLIAQVYFYFGKVESTAKRFSDMYHQLVMIRINLGGVFQLLEEPPSVEDQGHIDFPSHWKRIFVEKVGFSYKHRKVLENIHLSINRGEKIGLVGPSGAGKSTLLRIFQKLYFDYEGTIYFDAYKLRDIKRATFTPQMGVVLQDTELFNLSIKDNITLGKEPWDRKWFDDVLYISGLDDLVTALPRGESSLVGEKGVKLSGGEKQRLGIARALYRRPQILILDEATSQLDADLEVHIQERLRAVAQKMTVLVVAHRLASLQHMDRIVVLQHGGIVESGDFEELVARKGLFYDLWEKQNLELQT